MDLTSSPNLASSLIRASQHWQKQHQRAAGEMTPSPTAFTIGLSREVGALGTTIAREVGKRLNWQVYDNELLERIAQEMNLRTSLLQTVDERRMSWLEECMESFSTAPVLTESAYVRHLIQTVLALGSHGECLIVGRGAPHILPPATTLRVRLVADLEDRTTVIAKERGLSRQDAARYVQTTDRERALFVKDHFQKDPTHPEGYDLVLNSSRFSVGECADLIVEALRRMQSRVAAPAGGKE